MSPVVLDRPGAPVVVSPINERYELGPEYGHGSSAVVFAATDTRLDRPVTIKLFDTSVAREPRLLARFRQQVAKAAGLKQPNIAAVLDAGVTEALDGTPVAFVVTEPAGTHSLRDLLDRRGRLAAAEALPIARQVAAALAYAHEHGVVHADVKPENVILDADDERARLVDFSLSFVNARTGVVTPDTIARRAAYLAPEQVRGAEVSPAVDVYALGVLLYEMLVGRPPFVGPSPERTAELRVLQQPRPGSAFDPTIPPELDELIARALERDPGRRWRSMAELAAALERLDRGAADRPDYREAEELDVVDHLPEWGERAPRRRPTLLGLFLVSFLAVLVLLAGLTFVGRLGAAVPSLSASIPQASPARVPSVEGETLDEARAQAAQAGMQFVVLSDDRLSDTGVPKGRIIQQTPVAGFPVDASQPLRVTVSGGAAVPNLIGKPLPQAQAEARQAGWTIARVDHGPQPGAQPGTVAIQSPAPGMQADAPGEIAVVVAQ